jgi:phage terminase large subunit-like protein
VTAAGRKFTLAPGQSIGRYYPAEVDFSLADKVALLPKEEQDEILKDLDPDSLVYDFTFWGRPSQLSAIESHAPFVIALAGRGWGKTRVMSEWVHRKAMDNPGCRIALIGRVVSDVRDVMILGESGLLSVTPPDERPKYVASVRRVKWDNGSEAITYSADIASQMRGPQQHFAACDELAAWRQKPDASGANMWANVQMATRLGSNPQIFVATTPRRVPDMMDLYAMAQDEPEKVDIIRGSTFANRHLAKQFMDTVRGMYEGSHLGAQELEGELVGDITGALLNSGVIEDHRQIDGYPDMLSLPVRAIGVDPSVSERPHDECGIVAVGSTGERQLYKRHAWIYEDASLLGSPQVWARRAVEMARKYKAVVVVEDNQGGEMVRMVMKNVDKNIPVVKVRAFHGKALRAEPVVLAYEQGRVHHTDYFGDLESQLTTWVPGETLKSPDRLDAAVHALAALLVKQPKGWAGELRITSAAGLSIPGVVPTVNTRSAAARLPINIRMAGQDQEVFVPSATPANVIPLANVRRRATGTKFTIR